MIHIEGGSDFFVSIIGSFTLSCFGVALNNLALALPRGQPRLSSTPANIKLPSMKYRERRTAAMTWDVPLLADLTLDPEKHPIPTVTDSGELRLKKSSSLAATGAAHNFSLDLTLGVHQGLGQIYWRVQLGSWCRLRCRGCCAFWLKRIV